MTGDIYYSNTSSIGVCSNNGSHCKLLCTEYVDEPRGLILYPQRGKMYWGNQGGAIDMIVVASMDGIEVRPLKYVHSPSELAIDFDDDRLYWSDYSAFKSCQLDGEDCREIYKYNKKIGSSFAIALAVYKDRLYISSDNGVKSVDKITGMDEQRIVDDEKRIYDIQIDFDTKPRN